MNVRFNRIIAKSKSDFMTTLNVRSQIIEVLKRRIRELYGKFGQLTIAYELFNQMYLNNQNNILNDCFAISGCSNQ